jgi:hypothetical protein
MCVHACVIYELKCSPPSNADPAQIPAALIPNSDPVASACRKSLVSSAKLGNTGDITCSKRAFPWKGAPRVQALHSIPHTACEREAEVRSTCCRRHWRMEQLSALLCLSLAHNLLFVAFSIPWDTKGRSSMFSRSGNQQSQSLSSLHAARAAEATCTNQRSSSHPYRRCQKRFR